MGMKENDIINLLGRIRPLRLDMARTFAVKAEDEINDKKLDIPYRVGVIHKVDNGLDIFGGPRIMELSILDTQGFDIDAHAELLGLVEGKWNTLALNITCNNTITVASLPMTANCHHRNMFHSRPMQSPATT